MQGSLRFLLYIALVYTQSVVANVILSHIFLSQGIYFTLESAFFMERVFPEIFSVGMKRL